jgi:hypothetical protein
VSHHRRLFSQRARETCRTRQKVLATLGRVDGLRESGEFDALLQSRAKFAL